MNSTHDDRLALFAIATLVLACSAPVGDPAPRPSKTEPSTTTQRTASADPHAGHAMPAPTAGADSHAAHRMDAGADARGYDLVLTTDPAQPTAGSRTHLTFDPRTASGTRVERLAIVHEKPLHLIVVSRDLSWFAHEHPEARPDGTYALDFEFPRAGEFVLFGDFKPEAAAGQIVRKPVSVAGTAAPLASLDVDDRGAAKRFGELEVALGPAEIRATAETMLEFEIRRGGKPAEDLRPYLGALGHCVVIDQSATKFLHSHPLEAAGGDTPGRVRFHTVFPDPGKYKVWGQFDVGGAMLIADFVVEVAPAGGDAGRADPHAGHPH